MSNRKKWAEELEQAAIVAGLRPASERLVIGSRDLNGWSSMVQVFRMPQDITAADVGQLAAYVREAGDAHDQLARYNEWIPKLGLSLGVAEAVIGEQPIGELPNKIDSAVRRLQSDFADLRDGSERLEKINKALSAEIKPAADVPTISDVLALITTARDTLEMADEPERDPKAAHTLRKVAHGDLVRAIDLLKKSC